MPYWYHSNDFFAGVRSVQRQILNETKIQVVVFLEKEPRILVAER